MTPLPTEFHLRYGELRVRVRVLPSVAQVDRAYYAGRRCRDSRRIYAYFEPEPEPHAARVGTVVLPANGALQELVPHEMVHAVMHELGRADRRADEYLAGAVGVLTARALARLRRLGLGRAR